MFAIVIYKLTDEVRQGSPWTKMFADDFIIWSESRKQKHLERWRYALERREMTIGRTLTENVCERETRRKVKMHGAEVMKLFELKASGQPSNVTNSAQQR